MSKHHRTPFFILIDTSRGARDTFKKNLQFCKDFIKQLRMDPYMLEQAYIYIITTDPYSLIFKDWMCNPYDMMDSDTIIDSIQYRGTQLDFERSITDLHEFIRKECNVKEDSYPRVLILGQGQTSNLSPEIITFYKKTCISIYLKDNYSPFGECLSKFACPTTYDSTDAKWILKTDSIFDSLRSDLFLLEQDDDSDNA